MINNKADESAIEGWVLGVIPRLIAVDGPLRGRTFYLDEQVVSMGRKSSNHIRLEDPLASRRHCEIRNQGEQHIIEDLNSTNGTYVNGSRVKVDSLSDESLIEIGASRFLFRLQNSQESIALGQNLVSEDKQQALVLQYIRQLGESLAQ
jgi:pSer/pThr/pTyr-binding forkhead associated (FHA) protein